MARSKHRKLDRRVKLARQKTHPSFTVRHWRRSLPFFLSGAGILVHRVESAMTFLDATGRKRHTCVKFMCGNGGSLSRGSEFLSEPPQGRLVCLRCEMMAKFSGLPSADEIVGHHVHVGRVRVEQACCVDHKDRN